VLAEEYHAATCYARGSTREDVMRINGETPVLGKNPRCDHPDCERRAYKYPIVTLGHAVIEIPMPLCNEHADPVHVLQEYTEEVHQYYAEELRKAGRPVPNRSEVKIRLGPIVEFTGSAVVA
jgi:hypothetical protein